MRFLKSFLLFKRPLFWSLSKTVYTVKILNFLWQSMQINHYNQQQNQQKLTSFRILKTKFNPYLGLLCLYKVA